MTAYFSFIYLYIFFFRNFLTGEEWKGTCPKNNAAFVTFLLIKIFRESSCTILILSNTTTIRILRTFAWNLRAHPHTNWKTTQYAIIHAESKGKNIDSNSWFLMLIIITKYACLMPAVQYCCVDECLKSGGKRLLPATRLL